MSQESKKAVNMTENLFNDDDDVAIHDQANIIIKYSEKHKK